MTEINRLKLKITELEDKVELREESIEELVKKFIIMDEMIKIKAYREDIVFREIQTMVKDVVAEWVLK
jgi:predicted nuclease with TOPRIM domain